MNRDSSVED